MHFILFLLLMWPLNDLRKSAGRGVPMLPEFFRFGSRLTTGIHPDGCIYAPASKDVPCRYRRAEACGLDRCFLHGVSDRGKASQCVGIVRVHFDIFRPTELAL